MSNKQKTTVSNIRRETFDVYVGRTGLGFTSEFGNPYRLYKDGTREEIIEKFRTYFYKKINADEEFRKKVLELQGKKLGCWCAPHPCHADIVAKYLNHLAGSEKEDQG